MKTFITATFGFLALAFYQLSGGADFVPEERAAKVASVKATLSTKDTGVVTRMSGLNNASVTNPAVALVQPAVVRSAVLDPVAAEKAEALRQFASMEIPVPTRAQNVAAPAAVAAAVAAPAADIRLVSGTRVNMRHGPGTGFDVIDTLTGGTEVEVLEVNADGWARLIHVASGAEGWMAERLLTDS